MSRTWRPMKAIRKKCIECSAGSATEITHCTVTKCPLHDYRFGHKPKGYEDIEENVIIDKSFMGKGSVSTGEELEEEVTEDYE